MEHHLDSNTQFNEYDEEVLQLQLYPYNKGFKVEICKYLCFFLTMIIGIGFIIAIINKNI